MGLLSFDDYRKDKNESSPATRNKWAAALGLQPMFSADVFGHSTPPPAVADELLKKLGDKPKKKKAKKKHESTVVENKGKMPDRSIDRFIDKAEKAAKDVDDTKKKADKEEKDLDAKLDKKKKDTSKPAPTKSAPKSPSNEIDDEEGQEWAKIFNNSLNKNGSHDDDDHDEDDKDDDK